MCAGTYAGSTNDPWPVWTRTFYFHYQSDPYGDYGLVRPNGMPRLAYGALKTWATARTSTACVMPTTRPDAGTPDAGRPDAGFDAGVRDAGPDARDAGAGAPDAGALEPDAGAMEPDAGPPTEPVDAGAGGGGGGSGGGAGGGDVTVDDLQGAAAAARRRPRRSRGSRSSGSRPAPCEERGGPRELPGLHHRRGGRGRSTRADARSMTRGWRAALA